VVILVERLLVLMATFYVFLSFIPVGKGLLVAVNLVYLTVYLYMFRAGVSTAGTVK